MPKQSPSPMPAKPGPENLGLQIRIENIEGKISKLERAIEKLINELNILKLR